MLYISVDEIKYGTVGATFNVAFSVPIDELPQLRTLHDKYAELNMKSFGLTASTADTPQTEEDGSYICDYCKYSDREWYEQPCESCHNNSGYKSKPQTERKSCKLELFDNDGNYIESQMDCGWK